MRTRVLFLSAFLLLIIATSSRSQVTSIDGSGGESQTASAMTPSGTWLSLPVPSSPPPQGAFLPDPRMLHTAIYDPENDRIVVYGGLYFGNAYGEVLVAPLSTGLWKPLVTGSGPLPRRDHVAIYDSARKRMVIFGGSGGADSYYNDTWALDLHGTPAWSPVSAAGAIPAGRFAHTAIYDPVRDRMIVFGGYKGGGVFTNEVYALDFASNQWTNLSPGGAGPSGRDAMTAVYDPARDRMLVFGGWTGSQFDDRVWALSLSGSPAWSEVATSGTKPTGRRHYTMAYDANADQLVLWGGYDVTLSYRSDAWVLPLSGGTPAWSQLSPSGLAPTGRNGHRAIFDPTRNRLVTFGGYDGNYRADEWWLTLGPSPAWQQVDESAVTPPDPNIPPPTRDQVAAFDSQRGRMLIFGGSGWGDSFSNKTYALSLDANPAWSAITPSGALPPPRFSHAGAYDPVRDRLIIFGGYGGSFLNDAWALSLGGTPEWTALAPTGTPPSGRDAMTMLYDSVRDRMIVYGGWTGTVYSDEVWSLQLGASPAWVQVKTNGNGPSRRHYTGVYDPAQDRLVLTGGFDTDGYHDDVWTLRFNEVGDGFWHNEKPKGPAPTPRNGGRAVLDAANNRMLLFGGYDNAYRNDLWSLNLTGKMTWTELVGTTSDLPGGRMLHTAILDVPHSRMIVYGGLNGGFAFGDVWAFDFSGNSSAQAPAAAAALGSSTAFRLEIASVAPNSSTGPVVRFTLPDARPAEIALYTVSGRRVAGLEVGGMGPGEHQAALGQGGRIATGIYLVRLTNGAESRTAKVLLGVR